MTTATELAKELLPCPFCGSTDISEGEVLTTWGAGATKTQSMCYGCGALGPEAKLPEGKVDYGNACATEAWNRRAALDAATPEPKLVLALPDYEKRQVVVVSDEVIDGERLVCIAIRDAATEAQPVDEKQVEMRIRQIAAAELLTQGRTPLEAVRSFAAPPKREAEEAQPVAVLFPDEDSPFGYSLMAKDSHPHIIDAVCGFPVYTSPVSVTDDGNSPEEAQIDPVELTDELWRAHVDKTLDEVAQVMARFGDPFRSGAETAIDEIRNRLAAGAAGSEAGYRDAVTDEEIAQLWDAQRKYHGGEPCKVGHVEFARAVLACRSDSAKSDAQAGLPLTDERQAFEKWATHRLDLARYLDGYTTDRTNQAWAAWLSRSHDQREGWISVEERLPDERGTYIVFRPDAHHRPACDPNVSIRGYHGDGVFDGAHQVTHWQELPAAPKTGDNHE